MRRALFVLFAATLCIYAQFPSPPRVERKSEPEYTAEARQAKLQGDVTLSAVITIEGNPTEIKVLKTLGMGLDEKAVECLSKWRFRPGSDRYGEPTPMTVTVVMMFRLV